MHNRTALCQLVSIFFYLCIYELALVETCIDCRLNIIVWGKENKYILFYSILRLSMLGGSREWVFLIFSSANERWAIFTVLKMARWVGKHQGRGVGRATNGLDYVTSNKPGLALQRQIKISYSCWCYYRIFASCIVQYDKTGNTRFYFPSQKPNPSKAPGSPCTQPKVGKYISRHNENSFYTASQTDEVTIPCAHLPRHSPPPTPPPWRF